MRAVCEGRREHASAARQLPTRAVVETMGSTLESRLLGGAPRDCALFEGDDDDAPPRPSPSARRVARAGADGDGDGDGDGALYDALPPGAAARVAAHDAESRAALARLSALPPDPFAHRVGGPAAGARAVLADARFAAAQAAKAADRARLRSRACVAAGPRARDAAAAAGLTGPPSSLAAEAEARRRVAREDEEGYGEATVGGADSAEDAGADADEDADKDGVGFREAYRRARLAAMRRSAALPTYGAVVEVGTGAATDADAFDDAGGGGGGGGGSGGGGGAGSRARGSADLASLVDGCHPDAPCLLLIWDRFALPECAPWLRAWAALAAARPRALFLTLRAGAVSAHWEPLSLPALAVYRGGATVAARVRLHARAAEGGVGAGLGARPSPAEVEAWLEGEGFL